MYHFPDEINYNAAFWFDKKLIENMIFAGLPANSRTILPVIKSYANADGIAFPDEQTIAILSGRTEKTVRAGIKNLEGLPGLKVEDYTTRRGRRSKRFVFDKVPREKGRSFPFHRCIFEGGNWCETSRSGQALYLVLRYFGFYDYETYEEDETAEGRDFDEAFRTRRWEYCEAEKQLMAHCAGIDRRSVDAALGSLQKNFLTEPLGRAGRSYRRKVFLIPPERWECAYLNAGAARRYRPES